ncbi:MAG: enoyl-CoA hydratase/isomerase family protein [Pseudomonadota bacterium]|jgi:enoyl-CoA hydratase/carnithine racemase|nr:enoyl-CoA hydratase/isomerase family protein [Pseudomonadota bacterium]
MISYAKDASIGTITMARPPVNAMDGAFVAAFDAALGQAEASEPTVLVIRSEMRCFSAGADLGMIQGYFGSAEGTAAMVAYVKELHRLFRRLETIQAVTLASIGGPALGGGLELALSCDLRIASTSAKIGLPEARVGMIPGAGGTQRLPRLCGPGVASRLILGGEIVDGAEAHRLGIAQWVAAPDELEARTAAIAERAADLSRPALLASKDCIAAYFDPEVDGYAREIDKPLVLMETVEARTRIAEFFNAARKR